MEREEAWPQRLGLEGAGWEGLGSRLAVLVDAPSVPVPSSCSEPGTPLDRLLHFPQDGVSVRNCGEHASEGVGVRRSHQCTSDPVPGAKTQPTGPATCRPAVEGHPADSLGGFGPLQPWDQVSVSPALSPFLSNFLPEGGLSGERGRGRRVDTLGKCWVAKGALS